MKAAGGAPEDLASLNGFTGGAWNRSGTMLYGSAAGIFRLSAEGGTQPEPVTTVEKSESGHFWPRFLPDGRHFLFMAGTRNTTSNRLMAGTLGSPALKDLGPIQTRMEYDPRGYVLYGSDGVLMARRFDARGLRFTGEPFPVAERV